MLDLNAVLAHKLLFVSGKGGVGKTLMSACLAVKAARLGKRVLLVESTAQEQQSPLFGRPPSGHKESVLAERISGINLNPKECFREYVVDHLGHAQLYKRVFDHRVMKSFLEAIPGLQETMLLGRLYHACVLQTKVAPYDLVIFDAPAAGHCLQLLTTPAAVLSSGLGGPLVREVQRVKDFLNKAQTSGFLFVCQPEELVVSETLEFLPKLQAESPLACLGVLVNRAELAVPLGLVGEVSKWPKTDAYLAAKTEAKQDALALLCSGLGDLGFADRYSLVRDLGFIREPLSASDVDRLFEGVVG